ncbi:hypothetical protein [Burkholderia phage FLC9]|nr:hypothetical protein [Burkholderia phage FLC9]
MHGLFNLLPGVNVPTMYAANWHYARDGLRHNLKKVVEFYRYHSMAVESEHFLIRLLQSIAVGKHTELHRYYDIMDSLSLNLGMALKMTSPISRGHPFKGVFYHGCTEVLIAENADFDVEAVDKNWENVQAIRVLRHPRSDLMLNLPDGKKTGTETGIAVIAINIPMLAVQYRAFRLREDAYSERTGEPGRTIQQFVHMHVLPNMLYSHFDYVMFNRIYNLERGIPMGEGKAHPFYITDFSLKLNAVQATILANLQAVGQDFTGILRSIPAVTKESLNEVMTVPDMAQTIQVVWALALSRFPAIQLMVDLSEGGNQAGANVRNQQQLNLLVQSIRMYKTGTYFSSVLQGEDLKLVNGEIDDLIEKIQEVGGTSMVTPA